MLKFLKTRLIKILTRPILQDNDVKLKQLVKKPVAVCLGKMVVESFHHFLLVYLKKKFIILLLFKCKFYIWMLFVQKLEKLISIRFKVK